MARIPDATALGARPIPTSQRQIAVDKSALILGRTASEVGQNLQRTGAVLQEREDRFQYATAKSALLQADVEARRELENDEDWATYETRYRERMGKAREKATGLIASPRDRALFEQDTALDLERGALDVQRAARGVEVKVKRAALESSVYNNHNSALNTADAATREAIVQNTLDLILSARNDRVITPEEAGDLQRKWTAEYGKGFVVMRSPEEQVRLLKKPKGTPADFIDPAERAVMLERAEKDIEQEQRAAAQEERSRIQQARSDYEWKQRQAADQAWKHISAGGSVASIPRPIWNSMDGRDQQSLLNDEKNRLDGGKTPTDWKTYLELRQMATDPDRADEWEQLKLTEYYDKLGPTERKELIAMKTAAPGDPKRLDAATLEQQISVATEGWKTKSDEDKARAGKFRRMVQDQVDARARQLGRDLAYPERQEIIDQLIIEGEVRSGDFWSNDKKLRFEVLGTEDDLRFVPEEIAKRYDAMPAEEKARIKVKLIRSGKYAPTPTNVLSYYEEEQARKKGAAN